MTVTGDVGEKVYVGRKGRLIATLSNLLASIDIYSMEQRADPKGYDSGV